MKWVATLTLILFSANLWAKQGEILKCLGEEEKRFHVKKDTGPVYNLNQTLIGELIQIPGIDIGQADYHAICSGQKFSESWKLLELSIKKGKSLFVINPTVTGMQRNITEGMIDDYVEATRETLLNFITQIQALAPSAACLKEEIPELDAFFTEIKYLQEDVDMKVIFAGKDQAIFEKLKNYPLAFEKCRARLKKKAKPVSKARPKKS